MRKLSNIALSYAVGVFLAQYLIPRDFLLIFAGVFLIALGLVCFIKSDKKYRLILIISGLSLGLIWSFGHFMLFIAPAERLAGETHDITARVVDYPVSYERYSWVKVKLETDGMPKETVKLYINGEIPELEPGDLISGSISFKSAAMVRDEESGANLSKGIFLTGSLKGELQQEGKSKLSFLYAPLRVANGIKSQVKRDYPEDVSHLMTALLTGDKTEFYKDAALSESMSTAGLIHIVAVSGMHVVFVVSMINAVFRKKRTAALVSIPVIVFFIFMTGARPSVIRAGIMQMFLLTAPIFRREQDYLTSLSASLALLLIINPSAAMDVGLQLSFAATGGILLLTPGIDYAIRKDREDSRLLRFAARSVSASLGAMIFTTPLAALHFGHVSLIAPVTNLLCLTAMSFSFTAGMIIAPIGMLIPALGKALAWCVAWILRYVIMIVGFLARLPFASVYTTNNLVGWWLLFTYCVIFISYVFKRENAYRPIIPACLCITALFAMLTATGIYYDRIPGIITVLDVGQGQSITAISGKATVVIDCGGSEYNYPGSTAGNYLLGKGRRSVDLLVFTHLHADHANGGAALLSRLDVKNIAIPKDEEESDIKDEILSMAELQGINVHYIDEDMEYKTDKITLKLFAPLGVQSSNECGVIVLGAIEELEFLIPGDADMKTEAELLKKIPGMDLELLVAGHHGSKYSTSEALLKRTSPQVAVISVGYNSYGHPSVEALHRLSDSGAAIYRTDLNGNIELRLN